MTAAENHLRRHQTPNRVPADGAIQRGRGHPTELVRQHYFGHLTQDKFLRQILAGKIRLPVVRMTDSRKTARGVHLNDLADYIDKMREMALQECEQLSDHGA